MTMIAERDYWMRARNDGHALQFKLKEAGAAEKRIGGGRQRNEVMLVTAHPIPFPLGRGFCHTSGSERSDKQHRRRGRPDDSL
jgi:hypothetical protein